jgi:hypothetical protein
MIKGSIWFRWSEEKNMQIKTATTLVELEPLSKIVYMLL